MFSFESSCRHSAEKAPCGNALYIFNKHVGSPPNDVIGSRILLLIGICFSSGSENSNLLLDRCLGKMPHNILRAYLCSLQLCLCCHTFRSKGKSKEKQKHDLVSYLQIDIYIESK